MIRRNVPCVLVTVPSASQPGGVSQLFDVLRGHLGDRVDYFEVGARSESAGFKCVLSRLIKDYARFIRVLLSGRYDVVHINPSLLPKAIVRDGIFLILAKLLGKRVLVFFHGWDVSFERKLCHYFSGIFKWTYFQADVVLVLASEFSSRLISMGYSGPVRIGSTAIDDVMLLGGDSESCALKCSREGEQFRILFLSRIVKKKGVFEAVDAYWTLKRRYPQVNLTIAGEGPDLGSVKAYVSDKSISDVRFAGFVTGKLKVDAFRGADVYLFPTYSEGMPLSVLEAMAYGLPVVTRPVGALRDFFEDKKMGCIIESLAPHDIADALEYLLSNPELCLRVSKYNHAYAKQHFGARGVAQKLSRHYEEVLL